MAIGHYDLKRTKNKQYYFNLKASNGEVILTSEMYTTKAAANKGIRSVQANSPAEKKLRNQRKQIWQVLFRAESEKLSSYRHQRISR